MAANAPAGTAFLTETTGIPVPDGGTTGQVLSKTSSGYGWVTVSGGGGGSATGIVLTATSDGSADVSGALTSALAAAATAGLTLVIPAGDYKLTSGVVVPGNVSIRGTKARFFGSLVNTFILRATGNNLIEGLAIENNAAGSGLGIDIAQNATNIIIRRCSFKGANVQGVNANATGIVGLAVVDCSFDTVSFGVLTNSGANDIKNVAVRGCTFTNVYSDAIEFNHPSDTAPVAQGFIVTGNNISVPTGLGSGSTAGFGIGVAGVTECVISNNIITAARHEAIHIEDDSQRVSVTNNTVSNVTGPDATGGITVYPGCSGISISDNEIDTVKGSGVWIVIDGTSKVTLDVSITGNTIRNITGNGMDIAANLGNAFTITGNTIHTCSNNGIQIGGYQDAVVVSGNLIWNISRYGIGGGNTGGTFGRIRDIRSNVIYACTLGDYEPMGITSGNAYVIHHRHNIFEPSAATDSTGQVALPLVRAGRYAAGKLVLQFRIAGGNYLTRMDVAWDILWDGTTFNATPQSTANNGTVSIASLAIVNNVIVATVQLGTAGSPVVGMPLQGGVEFSGTCFDDGAVTSGTIPATSLSTSIAPNQIVGKGVKLYSTATTSASANSGTNIPLDSVAFNDDTAYFTTSGSQLTCKKAGLYSISFFGFISQTAAANFSFYVQRNGTTLQEAGGYATAGASIRTAGATVYRLSANDVLTLGVFSYSASTISGSANPKDVGIAAVYLGS